MRYERKYRIEETPLPQIKQTLQQHPLAFRELYPDRWINNVYLDTPALDFFKENLDGVGIRRKYRIRWYGEQLHPIEQSQLEVKKKHNMLGSKDVRPLVGFQLNNPVAMRAWLQAHVREGGLLEPVLLNRYLRSYYISYDGHYRLTIDREQQFFGMDHFFHPDQAANLLYQHDDALIVEVKYEQDLDEEWDRFGRKFTYPISKNSKYVNGVLLTGDY